MIARIDHIAIAVKDYEGAASFFSGLLGGIPGSSARDDSMGYFWQNLWLGDLSRLELLAPTAHESFLDGFLKKKEMGGVHHITLQTPDIKSAAAALERAGIPYFGFREYGNVWKELFIHPKHAFGVLIQIAEFTADDWLADSVKFTGGEKFEVKREEGGGCSLTIAHPGGGKATVRLTDEEAARLRDELSG
ncbi:MAG: VOC family protein [Spirochaetes bacterium]|nr:VOC family protein [Spirochaetota bacterium]